MLFVSATPGPYEEEHELLRTEQVIRPTGLLDPKIEVRSMQNPVDDLMEEIQQRVERDERTLVTTLTKRMAEELAEYLLGNGIRTAYIHSDVDTLERVQILNDLREGQYDVLVGVNLLREGLDLPEVSLVAILDADKEGFLRSHRSLTQTVGRAARNLNGKAIMYGDTVTESMQKTIDETNRRREIQLRYNEENHIVPQQIKKERTMGNLIQVQQQSESRAYVEPTVDYMKVAEQDLTILTKEQMESQIKKIEKKMQEAAKRLDFVEAALLRDEMLRMKANLC